MIAKNVQNRRNFMKITGAGLASMSMGCSKVLKSIGLSKKIPIGLQLYSVRDDCKKDFAGTVAAVADMGYDGVEFAGYYDYSAKNLRKLLDDNGLKCCGTHIQLDTLMGDNLASTIEYNKTIGNKFLIVPFMPENLRPDPAGWRKVAALFNELSEKVKPHGMYVGYHNHDFEFTPMNGEMPWDLFFGNTNKRVVMQIDVGNALHGGGNPIPYMSRYPGRMLTVHLKEYSASNPDALFGEGDVKWDEVFDLCESVGGTEWYIIEQERYPYPPMESVKRCLQNFRNMGK